MYRRLSRLNSSKILEITSLLSRDQAGLRILHWGNDVALGWNHQHLGRRKIMGYPDMACCGHAQGDAQGHGDGHGDGHAQGHGDGHAQGHEDDHTQGHGHVQGHVHAEASIELFICYTIFAEACLEDSAD